MTAILVPPMIFQGLTPQGLPLVGGLLNTYIAGTSIPQATYTDSTAGTPNTNPVVLNASGQAPVWLDPTKVYKFVLTDKLGNPMGSTDQIQGSLTGAALSTIITQAYLGAILSPPTTAETNAGFTTSTLSMQYPYGNILRYGLVANSSGAATANTAILKQLWNTSGTGIPGAYQLPIITGADIWYFSGNIPMCDGVRLDLNGQTMSWAFATALADNSCGVLTAQRNVAIENGNITWNLTNSTGTSNYGNGLMFGGRGSTPSLFPAVYDSLLASPMGNITVRNVTLNGTASATQSRAFFMLGGLVNCIFENITIQGNAALLDGHYYEFGYATNPTDFNSSQSSHAHNLRYLNWVVDNCVNSAISGNGAYDVMIDGLISTNSKLPIGWGIGEAAFMNPWNPTDLAGAKSLIHVKNCVVSPLFAGGTGVTITGSVGTLAATAAYRPQWVALHTYNNIGDFVFNGGNIYKLLTGAPGASGNTGGPTGTALSGITDGALTWGYINKQFSTDLLDCVVDNVKVFETGVNAGGGYGVNANASTKLKVTNCYFQGCQRGVSSSQDATRVTVEDCVIRDCTNNGIDLAGIGQTGVYPSGRTSMVRIANNWIVGCNISSGAGAIQLTSCIGAVIEGNRFGYETAHDDVAETTQLAAVSIDSASFNCHVRNNYVAAVTSGQAYVAASGGSSRNNRLENNRGVQSASGSWITDWTSGSAQAITANGQTIAVANLRYVRVAPNAAYTGIILQAAVSAATEPATEVIVINESAAADTLTMAAVGTSNVANGVSCVIPGLTARRFVWDAANAYWAQMT